MSLENEIALLLYQNSLSEPAETTDWEKTIQSDIFTDVSEAALV